MTYLQFLAVFALTPVVALLLLLRGRVPRAGLRIAAVLSLAAFVYTAPWDNLIVVKGVWSYSRRQVLGIVLGVIPLEEYLFYVLQVIATVLFCLWLLRSRRAKGEGRRAKGEGRRAKESRGVAGIGVESAPVFLLALLLGDTHPAITAFHPSPFALRPSPIHLTYLIFELTWALPVLAGMGAIGRDLLWRARRLLLVGALAPTLYFSAADAVAIHNHIWTLNPVRITGVYLGPLPLEEFIFFLVTNLMTVEGFVLLGNTGGPSLLQLLRRHKASGLQSGGTETRRL